MLDAATPLPVPGAEVLAWVDLDTPDVVWALPTGPRLALGQDGLPDAALLIYRRGTNAPPDGGQLNLTVDVALTAAEHQAAAAAGAARRPQPEPDAPQPPPVEVRAPQWVDGAVHAELLPGLTVDGKPSLLGDNSCVLLLQLDAARAASVLEAWQAGFPDATIELDGTIDGATAAAARATASSSCDDHASTNISQAFTVAASSRTGVRVPLQLRGPLRLPAEARTARRTDLTL